MASTMVWSSQYTHLNRLKNTLKDVVSKKGIKALQESMHVSQTGFQALTKLVRYLKNFEVTKQNNPRNGFKALTYWAKMYNEQVSILQDPVFGYSHGFSSLKLSKLEYLGVKEGFKFDEPKSHEFMQAEIEAKRLRSFLRQDELETAIRNSLTKEQKILFKELKALGAVFNY